MREVRQQGIDVCATRDGTHVFLANAYTYVPPTRVRSSASFSMSIYCHRAKRIVINTCNSIELFLSRTLSTRDARCRKIRSAKLFSNLRKEIWTGRAEKGGVKE